MNEFIVNFGIPETLKGMDIPSLSKKTVAYGEETSYLPLQYKKMWFRHVHPLGCIKYATQTNADNYVVVEAYVYADRTDENYIGIGRAVATEENTDNTKFMTPIERGEMLLATARGLAASKALADAGFGLQFYGDLIDPETYNANNSDKKPEFESTPVTDSTPVPDSTPAPEKAKKPRKQKEKPEEMIPEEVTENAPEETSEEIVNETTTTAPSSTTSMMSYEDACKVVVTIGPMKGKMLGDIISANPAYCAYMYGQKASITEDEIKAVIAICNNNEIAKRRLLTAYPDALN